MYKLYGTGKEGEIAADADSARVLLHPETMKMISAHSSSSQSFIKRCMAKRPLSFYHIRDTTVPRLTDSGAAVPAPQDHHGWVVNKANGEYLTYPEIQLSSLLLVSSNTRFLNNCGRQNKGIPGAPNSFHPRGVIVGVVGPRFALLDQMDTKFMFVHQASTKPTANPIDKVMSDYYFDGKSPWNSYSQIQAMSKTDREERYIQTNLQSLSNPKSRPNPSDRQTINGYFDKKVYKKRLRLIIEPLLLDANKRASDAGTTAYLVITGFGLGFWAAFDAQKDLFIQYVLEIVANLSQSKAIPNVSDLHFSHVGAPAAFTKHSPAFTTNTGISVIHDDTNPTSSTIKLTSTTTTAKGGKDKLLVYAYAWDGNAYPGNEYWNDKIADSGDSQAASCSAITELHNPQINPEFMGKIETFGNPNPNDNASQQLAVQFKICFAMLALSIFLLM